MGLKNIIKKIGGIAPLLAKMLPIPGAGIAGDILASALGVENTPAAIDQAITTDPQALIKIKQAELDNKVELQKLLIKAEVHQISEVNETMRAEGKSEHFLQYAWRPIWGIVSALAFFVLVILVSLIAWDAVESKDMASINMIPQLIAAFGMLFGTPCLILGVASHHRGKEKRAAVGDMPPGKSLLNLLKEN